MMYTDFKTKTILIILSILIIGIKSNALCIFDFKQANSSKIWDSIIQKEIIYDTLSKEFKTMEGKAPSEYFQKNSLPTLMSLATSKPGIELIHSFEKIETKVMFDPTQTKGYKKILKSSNSIVLKSDELTKDSLLESVTIVPNYKNMNRNARHNSIDLEEILLATLTVEFGHFKSANQIRLEDELDNKIYTEQEAFANVYNTILNDAIKAGIAYRRDKNQKITKNVFNPIINIQMRWIGQYLKLDDENKKLYDQIVNK